MKAPISHRKPPTGLDENVGPLVACLAALAAIAAGIAARWAVGPILVDGTLFILIIPAVVLASMLAGLWPGLFASLAGAIAAIAFVAVTGTPAIGDFVGAAIFLIAGAAIAAGSERLRRAVRNADAANRALASREGRLRSILETVPDAVIVIDEQGLIQELSPFAERLFGWTEAETRGRNIRMLMPSPYREEHDSYLERYYRTGVRRIVGTGRVVLGERKDGSNVPLEIAIGEIRIDGKRFFTGFLRDITERQMNETRLQELQSELVHVSRLTALGEMASALAHELNQPLSAIANYLSGSRILLERDDIPVDRVNEALERAGAEALRAGQIIRRLRDFVARREIEQRPESLPKMVHDATALALVGAKEHDIRVRFDFDPAVDLVFADKVQVQQVVLNLIRNAVDAMIQSPPGAPRVLTISILARESRMVQVSVADTGPGVDEKMAGQLFQPFVTNKDDGMGVGLSISRTIVEAHGGRIRMERNADGGATFHFTLHSAEAKEPADGQ